jgi:hypothetical protein
MRTTPADGARLVHQLQGVKFGCHGTGALYGKKTIACFTDAVTKILRWTLSPDSCHRQGSSLARSRAVANRTRDAAPPIIAKAALTTAIDSNILYNVTSYRDAHGRKRVSTGSCSGSSRQHASDWCSCTAIPPRLACTKPGTTLSPHGGCSETDPVQKQAPREARHPETLLEEPSSIKLRPVRGF